MRIRGVVWFGLGLTTGVLAGVAAMHWRDLRRSAPVTTAGVFQDVLTAIRQSFVDSLSDEELYVRAAKGVVTTLGDPYSSFLAPEEFRRYREVLHGEGRSVGVTLADGPGGLRVTNVVRGSPADRAGVEPGQYLVELQGKSTAGLAAGRASVALRNDSAISIRVRSPGDSTPVRLELQPRELRLPPVERTTLLGGAVGYVAVRAISDGVRDRLEEALDDLDAGNLSGLVLDLRGNLGGRLDEGVAIADMFLDAGDPIGSVVKRNAAPSIYSARSGDRYPGLRLAILVDRNTASSAEIIAAALRDNGRAVLLGEKTFGKGLIQTTIPLGDSVAVRLSTGRWRSPSGAPIMGGLVPDSVITPSPADKALLRGLAADPALLARELERLARELVNRGQVADSVVLAPGDLERLEATLEKAGVKLGRRGLAGHASLVEPELRRLVATLSHAAAAAARWSLLTDPVIAAGLALLVPPVQ